MSEILSALAPFAGILAGSVAVGAFLDQYATTGTKAVLWSQINSADRQHFSSGAVNVVVMAYETIFGSQILSLSFFLRSFLVYFTFIGTKLATEVVKDIGIAHAFSNAHFVGIALAAVIYVAGGLLFWLANAQTLYFLRLAQRDPRPTPVALIFYADLLLTASIAVFGIALLLWIQTAVYVSQQTHLVTLDVRVLTSEESLQRDLANIQINEPGFIAGRVSSIIRERSDDFNKAAVVLSRNRPSPRAIKIYSEDLEHVQSYFQEAGVRIRRLDEDAIQFLDESGEVKAYISRASKLRTDWIREFTSKKSRELLCRELIYGNLSRPSNYVRILQIERDATWTLQRCASGAPGWLRARVTINADNLDLMRILSGHLVTTFETVVETVRNGVTARGFHPLTFLDPGSKPRPWRHVHLISEDEQAAITATDTDFLRAFLGEEAAGTVFSDSAIDQGFLVWLVLLTSLFTVALLISVLFAVLIARVAQMLNKLNPIFTVQNHPFVFVAVSAGLLFCMMDAASYWL